VFLGEIEIKHEAVLCKYENSLFFHERELLKIEGLEGRAKEAKELSLTVLRSFDTFPFDLRPKAAGSFDPSLPCETSIETLTGG
jgi:hypothetical protein